MNRHELAEYYFREAYENCMTRINGLTHLEARSAMQTIMNETVGRAVGEIVREALPKIQEEDGREVKFP